MRQTGRRAIGVAAIAAVAAAGLVMTAGTSAAVSSGDELTYARDKVHTGPVGLVIPDEERNNLLALIEGGASLAEATVPIGANTGPVELVIPDEERNNLLALIEGGASLAEANTTGRQHGGPVAAAAQKDKPRKVPFTQTGTGALINQNGSLLFVAAVTNSLDGDGAVVAMVTLNGNSGTDTAVRYQANGVQKFKETITNGAPDANGVIPFTGSGNCTGPGTGVHKHEKCSYTTTGTYDPKTSVVSFKITGTTTR